MTPLALDSTNQYEVFVNISQHQSDKPWSETRGTCLPALISCRVRTMNQVIVCSPEEKQQLCRSRAQVEFIQVMCLLFIPPCACLPPKRIHCFLCMHSDSALVRKSENGAHRGIWSHQISVMYSAPCVEMTSFSVALIDALKPTETWDWIFYICSNTNLRIMWSHLWYHVWKCRHAQSSSRQ